MNDKTPTPGQIATAIAQELIAKLETHGVVAFSNTLAVATAQSLAPEIAKRMDMARLRQEIASLAAEDLGHLGGA